jgi:hypothetical protein
MSLQGIISISSSSYVHPTYLAIPPPAAVVQRYLHHTPPAFQQLHPRDHIPNRYNLCYCFSTLEDGDGDGMKSNLPCSTHESPLLHVSFDDPRPCSQPHPHPHLSRLHHRQYEFGLLLDLKKGRRQYLLNPADLFSFQNLLQRNEPSMPGIQSAFQLESAKASAFAEKLHTWLYTIKL